MEILFVLGFFLMLMLTGISLLGIIAALVVATLVMLLGGMLAFVIKMLPWLLLTLIAVWIYREYKKPYSRTRRWLSR